MRSEPTRPPPLHFRSTALRYGAMIDELIAPRAGRFALTRTLARISEIRYETADTKTFVVTANRHWKGFIAGQHALIQVEVNGRLLKRPFSISSDPDGKRSLSFTIKRNDSGIVSKHLHRNAKVGDIIRIIGDAGGEFVLPVTPPSTLLFIGAGSGITPLHSMLLSLRRNGYTGKVVLNHVCRGPEDAIFGHEFLRIAKDWEPLEYRPWYTTESGRPTAEQMIPSGYDIMAGEAYVCGPAELMEQCLTHWKEKGCSSRLHTERYGLPPIKASELGEETTVECLKSGTQLKVKSGVPLLAELEAAGLHPVHGCRKGMCYSCRYPLKSGTVKNLLTGDLFTAEDEMIQLCVCTPVSPIQLDAL